MIHSVDSDLPSFKTLSFKPGLNILLAEKSPGAGEQQTRNRAGKSSLLQLIHFLTGANAPRGSLFRNAALSGFRFWMDFGVGDEVVRVSRTGSHPSRVLLSGTETDTQSLFTDLTRAGEERTVDEWKQLLGDELFGLPVSHDGPRYGPTFRMLFGYFGRDVGRGGFLSPQKTVFNQPRWQYQVALSCLLCTVVKHR